MAAFGSLYIYYYGISRKDGAICFHGSQFRVSLFPNAQVFVSIRWQRVSYGMTNEADEGAMK